MSQLKNKRACRISLAQFPLSAADYQTMGHSWAWWALRREKTDCEEFEENMN